MWRNVWSSTDSIHMISKRYMGCCLRRKHPFFTKMRPSHLKLVKHYEKWTSGKLFSQMNQNSDSTIRMIKKYFTVEAMKNLALIMLYLKWNRGCFSYKELGQFLNGRVNCPCRFDYIFVHNTANPEVYKYILQKKICLLFKISIYIFLTVRSRRIRCHAI